MLPSRSRLESWNADSLTFTGPAVRTAGESVERSVGRIATNLAEMPETQTWAGPAHEAATGMFSRAQRSTESFSDYATAIGNALTDGAATIGAARNELLAKADQVDAGPLNVSEGWVVLIEPGAQSAERIEELLALVATEQAAINDLLVAVGDADNTTADKILAVARPFGFAPPAAGGLPGMMTPLAQRPADDVRSPRDPLGLLQQATVRGEEMATTVRETQSGYNEEGDFEKILIMQDGSRIVVTEQAPQPRNRIPEAFVTEDHFDPNGELISWSTSSIHPNGRSHTIMNWPDGTQYVVEETADGVRSGAFNLPGDRHVVLPSDSPLLTLAPGRVGDVLTGLESHIDDGGKIPLLSMDNVEKLGAGAKYGGAALGTMSAMYDFLRAPTPADKCVSVFAGSFALAGNAAGGAGGAAIGAPIPLPGTTVGFAVVGSIAAGAWMKEVGTKVGEVLCGN